MRTLLATALALTILPAAAAALSCAPPNAGREFNAMVEKGQKPIIVIGTLTRDGKPRRKGRANVWIGYQLSGQQLQPDRTVAAFAGGATYRSNCIGRNCGRLPVSGTTGLFLLRQIDGQWPLITTGPCGGGHYDMPDRLRRGHLFTCVAEGRCGPDEIRALGPAR